MCAPGSKEHHAVIDMLRKWFVLAAAITVAFLSWMHQLIAYRVESSRVSLACERIGKSMQDYYATQSYSETFGFSNVFADCLPPFLECSGCLEHLVQVVL